MNDVFQFDPDLLSSLFCPVDAAALKILRKRKRIILCCLSETGCDQYISVQSITLFHSDLAKNLSDFYVVFIVGQCQTVSLNTVDCFTCSCHIRNTYQALRAP